MSLRHRPQRPAERLSDILEGLAAPRTGSVSLADVVAVVGERSFGALLVLLAIPNVLAAVLPGLSIVLGLPLMLLSLQLVVAAKKPWLPNRLARLKIRRIDLDRLVEKTSPHLRRLERDGLFAIVGAAVTVVCLALFGSVAFAFAAAASLAIRQLG